MLHGQMNVRLNFSEN